MEEQWVQVVTKLIESLSQINQGFGSVHTAIQQIADSINHLIKKIDDLPDEREMRALLNDITEALKEIGDDFSKIEEKEEQVFKIRRDLREALTRLSNLDKLADIIKDSNAAKSKVEIAKAKSRVEISKERLKTLGLIASGLFAVWKLLIERLF